MKRNKIIKKILWQIEKESERIPYKFTKLTREEMEKCPIANLEMIVEQIKIYKNDIG
jgi:hypothetical protein